MFPAWSDFYVILGSAAAALTGLQFVVIVLAADVHMGSETTTGAFATPTIVHFCMVLLVAAIMTAPWPERLAPAIALAVTSGVGVLYTAWAANRTRKQTDYVPVAEDWLTHFVIPEAAYASLLVAAILLRPSSEIVPSFVVAFSAILLLFVGIHNAWDSVTFIAHESRRRGQDDSSR